MLNRSVFICLSFCGLAMGAPLRVGAAKADITPPASMFPIPGYQGRTTFVGVHDPVFARALVVDNGAMQAAIIAVEVTRILEPLPLKKRVSAAIGIPADRIMIAATHDHNSPTAGPANLPLEGKIGEYYKVMEKGIIDAALDAKSKLQPARMGIGRGKSFVNVNRDERVGERYVVGADFEGPSDKTVEVIRFDNLNGDPIAIFTNYGVHGDVMFLVKTKDGGDEITGDLPGVAARYVENYYKDKVVAVWTPGSAGDQEVAFMPKSGGLNPGAAAWAVLDVQSVRLGREIVRVADQTRATVSDVRIFAAEKTATCPGQKVTRGQNGAPAKLEDAPPVDLELSLIMLNDIALGGVSGEVVTRIGDSLKKASPFGNTIMVSHANGTVGYIPDDSSYPRQTFEVLSSPFKSGCTEPTIVNGLVDMMKSYAAAK
jgi:hypothetical protein